MPKLAITSVSESVKLEKGRGNASITVTNTSGGDLRARPSLKPLGNTKAEWLSLAENQETAFPANAVKQYNVMIIVPDKEVPPRETPQRFEFKLNMINAERSDPNPGVEGPTVAFEVGGSPVIVRKWWPYVLIFVVALILSVGAWLLLKPSKMMMPNLVGKTAADATNQLAAVKATNSSIEYKTTKTNQPGVVIAQTPAPNTELAASTSVHLVVETTPQRTLTAPDVVNIPISKVDEILGPLGIDWVQSGTRVTANGSKQEGTVLSQSPARGRAIPPGGKLELVVEGPSVSVPSFLGMTFEDAVRTASQSGLLLIPVDQIVSSNPGHVMNQSIAPSVHAATGSEITLRIGALAGHPAPPARVGLLKNNRQAVSSLIAKATNHIVLHHYLPKH